MSGSHVYMHSKRSQTRVKDPAAHVDYGNIKTTQQALKVLVFKMLKLDNIKLLY